MKNKQMSFLLLLVSLILSALILSLPLFRFQANVYTKKSSNTVVGDEKYKEVRAEVEKVAEEYRAQGMEAEIFETVTERTNSKGETTSLVAFQVRQEIRKNTWSFLGTHFYSSYVLAAILGLSIFALLFELIGCSFCLTAEIRSLPRGRLAFRWLSMLCLMLDFLLIPVFLFLCRYLFWRKLTLYRNEMISEGKETFYAAIDAFLFKGKMGDGVDAVLKDLTMDHSPLLWVLMLCFLAAFAFAAQLRYGAVKNSLLRAALYGFIILVCVLTLYPYYVMLATAFRSNAETLDMYFLHLFPAKWEWGNLKVILSRGVPRYLLNSFVIAGGATVLAMFCGIPAAYAMARMDFKAKKFFLGFVIMSQMFSPVVLLIGISQLMNTIHLNDTLLGLIFINAAFNQAFAIWLLRGTFVAISPEMEQAAKIDGCTTVGSLVRILLPMAAPGIVTTLIFVFINAWNEYTISTVLISTTQNRPITVGITQFSSFNMIEWQYLFAASLLATVPVVILFMTIEKHLTSGLTSGGVKG